MTEALVVQEPGGSEIQLGTLNASTPEALLAGAANIATPLAGMIERQRLYSDISGKRYVRCEGWTTMGAMLGIIPREVSNECDADGIFTATVELVNMKTGAVVGRASAECGAPDELDRQQKPLWANRPRYARRSMAATRATSKAFRLSFSWIMTLAGYEATPAEEVPSDGFSDRPVFVPPSRTHDTSILPATPPGVLRAVGYLKSFNIKDGERNGEPWQKASFMVADKLGPDSPWLSTFDTKLIALSKNYADGGDLVDAWYKQNAKGFCDLVDISAAVFEK